MRAYAESMRAAVLAFLAVVALAGCGGSGPQTHATQRQIDPADQTWVESMLLTATELPVGWSPDPDDSPNPPDDCEQLDFSDLVITGEADAAYAQGETTALQNGIELYESKDDAHESLARGNATDLERCLFEVAGEERPADSDVSIRNLHVTELEPVDVGEEARVLDVTWDYVRSNDEGLTSFVVVGREAQAAERAPFAMRLIAFRQGRSIGVVSAGELFGPAPADIVEPLARKLDAKMTKKPPPS
jgi:hypothetical protein